MVQYFDAQSQNDNGRSVRRYTDLDLFFGKKSSNSDVSDVVDIQAVKRSIRNLVLTNIINFEPRARLIGVTTLPDLDRNIYEVSIEFYVVNTPTELVELTIALERIR